MAPISAESIYGLIPPPVHAPPKESVYVSVHHEKAVDERKEGKLPSRSMGYAKVTPNDPINFLRKGTREQRDASRQRQTQGHQDASSSQLLSKRKEAVPGRHCQGLIAEPTDVNYVRQNKLEAILATAKGNTKPERAYVSKPDYGKKPKYMVKREAERKAELKREEELQNQMKSAQEQKVRRIGDKEREELLAGLKLEWERVNQEFQLLSLAMDEMNKRRKEKLTALLELLEKDIGLMEKPVVYVRM